MTPRAEIIRQLQKRVNWLNERIEFHSSTRQSLIDEAARLQAEIDVIRAGEGEDALVLGWNVNEANEGQD